MTKSRSERPAVSSAGGTALVTGASSGIGAAFTQSLAALGYDLVIVARSTAELTRRAAELTARHPVSVTPIAADLSDATAVTRLVTTLDDRAIHIDLLVNSAGVSMKGPVVEQSAHRLAALIAVNVQAPVALTAAVLPGMLERGRGSIINVASTGAYQPAPYLAAYAASKAFVLSFTEALWAETRNSPVSVLAVSPGPTTTRMNPGEARGKASPEHVVATALKAIAHGRPSVIDGARNAVLAGIFSRLPRRAVLRITGAFMRHS
jgi:uncharacterized protein